MVVKVPEPEKASGKETQALAVDMGLERPEVVKVRALTGQRVPQMMNFCLEDKAKQALLAGNRHD